MHRILACIACLALAACGGLTLDTDRMSLEADLSSQPVLYVDQVVDKADAPIILVRPDSPVTRKLTAVFYPFRVMQDMDRRDHFGREVGRLFWQTWLSERVADVLVYLEYTPWPGGTQAAAEARARGADLAIGGDITHAFLSGTVGNTELAVRMQIYDAASGGLIWSMEHAGQMTDRTFGDCVLFSRRHRLPADPLYPVATALARDMAGPVKEWLTPVAEEGSEGALGGAQEPPAEDPDKAPVRIEKPTGTRSHSLF